MSQTSPDTMMKTPMKLLLAVGLSCPTLVSHGAETLAVVPDSAQALGMVGGRYANLHDASTVRVSPANMLLLEKAELLINASVWYGGSEFDSSLGASLDTEEPWKYLGSLQAVMPVVPGKVAVGLGISTPYGLNSSFPKKGALSYLVPYESLLLTADITPAVAFKVAPSVSVGAGLDIMYSKLTLKQVYPWSSVIGAPVPNGEVEFDGDGWGLGAYASVTWEITEDHRVSVVGRLPLKVEYEGTFEARGMPAALQSQGFRTSSKFESDITFPGSIAAGYGWDVTDRLTLGFDFMWSANQSHDDVPLRVGENQALLASNAVALDWKYAIDLGTGVSYKLNERWTVRAGYLFSENSQRDLNYTPAVPSGNRHYLSAGVGWQGERNAVDLAYAYVVVGDQEITGAAQPAFNGSYEQDWHVLTLSYTWRF